LSWVKRTRRLRLSCFPEVCRLRACRLRSAAVRPRRLAPAPPVWSFRRRRAVPRPPSRLRLPSPGPSFVRLRRRAALAPVRPVGRSRSPQRASPPRAFVPPSHAIVVGVFFGPSYFKQKASRPRSANSANVGIARSRDRLLAGLTHRHCAEGSTGRLSRLVRRHARRYPSQSMTIKRARDTSECDAGGDAEQTPEQQAGERHHHDEPVRQRGRNLAVGFRREGRANQMR
jgi:hypothetical protein